MKLTITRQQQESINNQKSIPVYNISNIQILCCFLLTCIFIFLKIKDYIDWNWIWILSPMWLIIMFPLTLWIILLLIWIIGNIILSLINT
jgi:hypothetical protein